MADIRNTQIELIAKSIDYAKRKNIDRAVEFRYADVLDYLVKNGAIFLPCKVGAYIFGVFDNDDEHIKEIYCGKVLCFSLDECNLLWARMKYACGLTYWHKIDDFGKKVFLTKEEAEQALKERNNR